MTVDWLTVAAQVLNFLLLVYLLKRFLYGPVVRAMARREESIAERLRDADRRKQDADDEARRHREAREALEARRERLMAQARDEADDLRQTLEADLRREMDEARERWRTALEQEQAAFLDEVRRRAAEQFEALARRALADLASAELETQMTRVLLDRLGGLDAKRRDLLGRAVGAGESVRVRSAFELPAAAKRAIGSRLRDVLGKEVEVAYETADEVVCGVEVRAGGESLAWTLAGYLDALERQMADGLGLAAAGRAAEAPR